MWVEYYRKRNWKILNKQRAGGFGGNWLRWTKSECRSEAKKYNNMSEFILNASGAYNSAKKNNWLSEVTKHF